MIRPDPRQFDMFAMIEQPAAAVPMTPTKWETIALTARGPITAAKVDNAYSAMSLGMSGKVTRPFQFRGETWVCTGGAHRRGDADYECYRIIPLSAFTGPGEAQTYHNHPFHNAHRDTLGGYHAMQAKHGKADVVLIGPPVVFVLKAGADA